MTEEAKALTDEERDELRSAANLLQQFTVRGQWRKVAQEWALQWLRVDAAIAADREEIERLRKLIDE